MAPKGHSTRPTADKARQALFNVLEHADWAPGLAGVRAVDLFAGSGAMGLEALSRGAGFCLFVDTDPAARAAIAANLEALRLGASAEVRGLDATRLSPIPPGGPFDLAFADPPYGLGLAEEALAALRRAGWLADEAVIVVERGAGEAAFAAPGFQTLASRAWGAARVEFLRPSPSSPLTPTKVGAQMKSR